MKDKSCFLCSCLWDRGTTANRNMQSVCVQSVETKKGPILMALLCEGKENSEYGCEASGYLAMSAEGWFYQELVPCFCNFQSFSCIRRCVRRFILHVHGELKMHGKEPLPETSFLMLIVTKKKYIVFSTGNGTCYVVKNHPDRLNRKEKVEYVGGNKAPDITSFSGKYRKQMFLIADSGIQAYLSTEKSSEVCNFNHNRKVKEYEIDEVKLNRRMSEIKKRFCVSTGRNSGTLLAVYPITGDEKGR